MRNNDPKATDSFNLVLAPWIPVLWADGRFERVGIWKALTEAGRIRQIAASNPMDNVALLRFLLAVLQWCKPNLNEEERGHLESADGVPQSWLKKLKEERQTFNLLGEPPRFFQDKDMRNNNKEKRPIGDLLVEFPTETKIAHFRHLRDGAYGLCPACCALGIVRFSSFANYAGRGYTPGLNGTAPAYAIMQDSTLLKTLRLHWPFDVLSQRPPPWLNDEEPSASEIDIPTAFAWRSRRLWLDEPGEDEEICVSCGVRARLIHRLAFAGGWRQPFEARGSQKKFWKEDPHLIPIQVEEVEQEDATDDQVDVSPPTRRVTSTRTILGFPHSSRGVRTHVSFWRHALVAVSEESGEVASITVCGPAASQTGMLYQDATALRLPALPRKGGVLDRFEQIDEAFRKIRRILKGFAPNPSQKHSERDAVLECLLPQIEADLRRAFSGSCAMDALLARRLRHAVEQVVHSTTPGSPLRRREALDRARRELNKALESTGAAEERNA